MPKIDCNANDDEISTVDALEFIKRFKKHQSDYYLMSIQIAKMAIAKVNKTTGQQLNIDPKEVVSDTIQAILLRLDSDADPDVGKKSGRKWVSTISVAENLFLICFSIVNNESTKRARRARLLEGNIENTIAGSAQHAEFSFGSGDFSSCIDSIDYLSTSDKSTLHLLVQSKLEHSQVNKKKLRSIKKSLQTYGEKS